MVSTQRSVRSAATRLVVLWTAPLISGAVCFAMPRPVTVADSIQMSVLVDPDVRLARYRTLVVKMSPDRNQFFIVTRKGNLATDCNEYSLVLYDMSNVVRSIHSHGRTPGRIGAQVDSCDNRPGISAARWLADSRTIAFLGQTSPDGPQLFTLDSRSAALHQRTSHPTPVLDYDIGTSSSQFPYMAEAPLDWSMRVAHGYEVGTETVFDVAGKGASRLRTRAAFYNGDTNDKAHHPIEAAPYALSGDAFGMWLSPHARWAVIVEHVASPPTEWWTAYAPVRNAGWLQGANEPATKMFMGSHQNIFMQFVLVDMRTGRSRPIVDAPSGLVFTGNIAAHWSSDDSSIILANTFLPIEGAQDRAAAERSPAVIEFDVLRQSFQRIVEVVPSGAESLPEGRTYLSSTFNGSDELSITWKTGSGQRYTTSYRKQGGEWRKRRVAQGTLAPARVLVEVQQGPNLAPELIARDTVSGRESVITDLNPQLRSIALGHVEIVHWKDKNQRTWTGGLVRPIPFVEGVRYPLVIQTHGFDPGAFLMDGPGGSTSGFAAREMAGRGLMVLQVADSVGTLGFRDEITTQVEGYEAAVAELDRRGLIDPARIGIHGWSRTGYYVEQALIFSPMHFAAASVSDASELSAQAYTNQFGFGPPSMLEPERMIGAELWGEEGGELWAKRDPIFHLDRLRTPLRIEVYGYPGLEWWDVYAILRRHACPVEYWSFPKGNHTLVTPWERLTSQEGTVDWYDFWLNDHEDTDPLKSEQYARWRELRKLRDAEQPAGSAAHE